MKQILGWKVGSLIVAAGLMCGCAYPVRNLPAQEISDQGYRWSALKDERLRDTLVIVTASGGGTRAATLELSVLQALSGIQLNAGGTLADEVDILSTVSGGSVTASYFALHGTKGFATLERDFIRQDGIGRILGAGLNPVGLARISTKGVERIDLLIEYLNKTLFKQRETYGTLLASGRRPFLILNAADMVAGTPFAFTQANFDLICSDMTSLPLSTAVAASAAFPVALSPVTLKNYSPCRERPPAWVEADLKTSWYDNPARAKRGRAAQAYVLGPNATIPKNYVHLLDGGIVDNLGLSEPYRILTTNAPSPGLLDEIAQGNIKKIVVVMINARSAATSDLDAKPDTPGIFAMLGGTISGSIDQATAGHADRFRALLREEFAKAAADLGRDFPDMTRNLTQINANTHLIEVDFDAIANDTCRQDFHNIGTSWTNSAQEIDALLLVGKALLRQAPDYAGMLTAVGGRSVDTTDVSAACARIAQDRKR